MTKKKPNATDIHVGARVRMRRMQLGMSQEKLGDAVSVTFQQVQKYEKGANRMGSSRLQQFSDVLGVPVAWFFDGAPGKHTNGNGGHNVAFTKFISEQQGQKLMEGWATLASRERLAIIDLVKTLSMRK
jgi:transcriptional regulator with XRE-family HTH domain